MTSDSEKLPERVAMELAGQAETGMGYRVVSVRLADGRTYDRVAVVGDLVAEVHGFQDIPFDARLVTEAKLTHAKWRFRRAVGPDA